MYSKWGKKDSIADAAGSFRFHIGSEATCAISSFSTSLSSEMNVSIPEGDDRKEMPIPEQFVHRISNGNLTSEVSDLYH